MAWVTKEQIRRAREVDVLDYILADENAEPKDRHTEEVEAESIR
jgi:hypothetical protein